MSRKGVGSVGQDGLVACLFDDGDDGHDNNDSDDDCTTYAPAFCPTYAA